MRLLFAIYIFLFLSFSTSLEENDKINNVEDLITLVDSKEFEDYIEELEEDEVNLKGLFDGDECLLSKSNAKDFLKANGISVNTIDSNVRFILGNCNPVLLVPGIYGTKLFVELQCRNIAEKERYTTLKEIRVFCGDSICADESVEREEHPLFIAIMDKAFSILGSEKDKYSSCLGYFMNYFQKENECPTLNGKKLCYYSPYITVGFYGGSTKTISKSGCGVDAIQNLMQSGIPTIDNIINVGSAKGFEDLTKKLKSRGYAEGFSLAGIPNDYRRFLNTNNFGKKVFRSQIERLYSNTGKPVVIVAHSYGTLLTLTNLVREENKDLIPKIKKFVAVAPPFAGSTELLDIFLHGMNDWNKEFEILGKKIKITNYNIFGQYLMYKSIPVIRELRPLSIAAKLFTDEKYKELGDALRERLEYEKNCKYYQCDYTTPKFDSLFKGYFPSFSDSECRYEINSETSTTFSRRCFTNMYNVADCPSVLTTSDKYSNPYGDYVEYYCKNTGPQFYYQGECNSDNIYCLDRIYSEKGPYVFDNTEAVDYLINRYNRDFAKMIDGQKIGMKFFETKQEINDGNKILLEYHNSINLIKDLPAPPVDTDLVYASFAKTINALILYDKNFTEKGFEYNKGGDTTVQSWSSLLTGFKWLYDKKVNNLSQKYKLVEYCSRLAESGKYKLDENKEQDFIALGCSCINSNNEYKSSIDDCTHAAMINDNSFIKYIMSIVDDPKNVNYFTPERKTAVQNYNSNIDYKEECNYDLKYILDTAH